MGDLQNTLRNRRAELNLSLREAAGRIGISHSYLSVLEKGIDPRTGTPIKPTPETLMLISKAYVIPYDLLMHDEGYIFEQWSGKDFPPDDTNQNLSNRDKRDIAKTLEAALKQLDSQDGLMFNNEPLTDTDRALLKQALEIGLKNVIEKNKLKYTPKKYRKDRTK